ncbi:UNVERIFIED_ORG: adenylosuccinate synthase [Methylorubrum zatmanii]
MPISVVVGGQYGSEGKGKVALDLARRQGAAAVVRVGGTNSGHTAIDAEGRRWALRQLPVSVLAPNTVAVLPPGALIDPEIFLDEVERLGLSRDRVYVSPAATLITPEDKAVERQGGLVDRIGSTGSGSGAALARRMTARGRPTMQAGDHGALWPYIRDTEDYLAGLVERGARIVIEGSQGFGLSLLHGDYPFTTSRDTTAAAFVAEAGLGVFDVDDITLVIRSYPIRVAGNSGPLPGEVLWPQIATQAGLPDDYKELTTATRKVRRVGLFEPGIVRRAVRMNRPTRIVLNHVDYVSQGGPSDPKVTEFIERTVEGPIGRRVDLLGFGPDDLRARASVLGSDA